MIETLERKCIVCGQTIKTVRRGYDRSRNLKILRDVLSGRTCKDVAKEHGISSPRVHQIIRRAVGRAGFEAQDSEQWLKEARTDSAHILAIDPSNLWCR